MDHLFQQQNKKQNITANSHPNTMKNEKIEQK